MREASRKIQFVIARNTRRYIHMYLYIMKYYYEVLLHSA